MMRCSPYYIGEFSPPFLDSGFSEGGILSQLTASEIRELADHQRMQGTAKSSLRGLPVWSPSSGRGVGSGPRLGPALLRSRDDDGPRVSDNEDWHPEGHGSGGPREEPVAQARIDGKDAEEAGVGLLGPGGPGEMPPSLRRLPAAPGSSRLALLCSALLVALLAAAAGALGLNSPLAVGVDLWGSCSTSGSRVCVKDLATSWMVASIVLHLATMGGPARPNEAQ